jgi:hypothetical protein
MRSASAGFVAGGRVNALFSLHAVSACVLLCALAVAVHFGSSIAPAALATQTAASVSGLGFWTIAGCIGCIAGFVIGAGTTIAGLAVFLAAHPELAILCAATCVAAVS